MSTEQKLNMKENVDYFYDFLVSNTLLKSSIMLQKAFEKNDFDMIHFLIQRDDILETKVFLWACKHGHIEFVKLLIQKVDPSINNDQPIRIASYFGCTNIVKLLLEDKRVDPSVNDNEAIRDASRKGHFEIVKLLLEDKRVDPSVEFNKVLYRASEHGQLDIVQLLLKDKRVEDVGWYSHALFLAIIHGHLEIVKFLLTKQNSFKRMKLIEALNTALNNGYYQIILTLLYNPIFMDYLKNSCNFNRYLISLRLQLRKNAINMIAYYSNGFYKHYKIPDDVMHMIFGEYLFGYTSKECVTLQNIIHTS